MGGASNSRILYSIRKISKDPKITADKGFSLWHPLLRNMHMFTPHRFGITTDPLSGSPYRYFIGILLLFGLKIMDDVC